MLWESVELSGYSHYSEKGYTILIPLVRSKPYDFIAEKDGEFIRVNVKLAGLKDKKVPTSWCIGMASGNMGKAIDYEKLNRVTVDIFLTWLPFQNRFIEIPGDYFVGRRSKCAHIQTRLYKNV